jgi:hypothetical protein
MSSAGSEYQALLLICHSVGFKGPNFDRNQFRLVCPLIDNVLLSANGASTLWGLEHSSWSEPIPLGYRQKSPQLAIFAPEPSF